MPDDIASPDLMARLRHGDARAALELGGTADARGVQLQRAAGRVGRELGLEDDDE